MRLLLDESVSKRLRRYLPTHNVKTVVEMGWGGVKNGKLLALAGHLFDVFITVDKNLLYQQNLNTLPVAIILLSAISNELSVLAKLILKLEDELTTIQPGSYIKIE